MLKLLVVLGLISFCQAIQSVMNKSSEKIFHTHDEKQIIY